MRANALRVGQSPEAERSRYTPDLSLDVGVEQRMEHVAGSHPWKADLRDEAPELTAPIHTPAVRLARNDRAVNVLRGEREEAVGEVKLRISSGELMARIGHASRRAALIYQHATEQRDREIAAYLDDAINDSTDRHRRDECCHIPAR